MNTFRVNPLDNIAFGKNWGWFFLWGLALFILGMVALGATTFTTLFSVVFLGFLLMLGGIVMIVDAFSFWWQKWKGFFLHLLIGLLYIVTGIVMIESPMLASVSITLFLGIFYLIVGVFRIYYSFSLKTPRWGLGLLNGILSLLLGGLILASWPASGLFIIGIFVGIDLLFSGITYMMAALAARSLTK